VNHEHCKLCPIKAGEYCRGEQVRPFCDKIDPSNPSYNPKYIATIEKQSVEWAARHRGEHVSDYPTLLAQAGNALGAAKRLAAAWWSGNEATVSLEEMEDRLTICVDCEHFDQRSIRCRKCGCWLKNKARLKTEHCPLDPPKW
jgi:hypothetical protein